MCLVLVICLLFSTNVYGKFNHQNNVCKTYEDYRNIENNPNCYYNPDAESTPSAIAKRYGYPFEKYRVATEDGYHLSLYRIPHNNVEIGKKRQPILLQHGIGITSAAFMLMGKRSLAFYLADNGYDVWLNNARGVQYSTKHVNLTMNDPAFWNFSFHEMGIYDLPAVINYVAKQTNQPGNIIYVGHSMGSTMSYIYASMKQDHAKRNLRGIVSLAPVAYMNNIKSLVKVVLPYRQVIKESLRNLGLHAVGQFPRLQRSLSTTVCGHYPFIVTCGFFNLMLAGHAEDQITPEMFPVLLGHYPTGTSIKTLDHFGQILASGGKFRQYDYGPTLNQKFYNSQLPPEYKVENINIPVHLINGNQDYLADQRDVKVLYERLRTEKSIEILNENGEHDFAHNDYLIGAHIQYFKKYFLDLLRKKLSPIST